MENIVVVYIFVIFKFVEIIFVLIIKLRIEFGYEDILIMEFFKR